MYRSFGKRSLASESSDSSNSAEQEQVVHQELIKREKFSLKSTMND